MYSFVLSQSKKINSTPSVQRQISHNSLTLYEKANKNISQNVDPFCLCLGFLPEEIPCFIHQWKVFMFCTVTCLGHVALKLSSSAQTIILFCFTSSIPKLLSSPPTHQRAGNHWLLAYVAPYIVLIFSWQRLFLCWLYLLFFIFLKFML